MYKNPSDPALNGVKIPLRLTLLGIWAEQIAHAFWPLWTMFLGLIAVLGFGALDRLPLELAWLALLVVLGGIGFALWYALRRFRRPTAAMALARLDRALANQPLAALMDAQAVGAADPASHAVWQAHRARMLARLTGARAVQPNLRLSSADPFALRYMALLMALLAVIFGSLDHMTALTALAPNTAPLGPTWEAWATPPAYTNKPALYLNDQPEGALTLPMGTKLQTRFYGAAGDLILSETVSNRTNAPPASDLAQEFTLTRSGNLAITGAEGRAWDITATPDLPPSVTATGDITRAADGHFTQGFTARDDYGVVKGMAQITLDLAAVDRRYGLAVAPDPIAPTVLDLPLPRRAKDPSASGTLAGDLSQSVLSNLPVSLTLTGSDAAGQTGRSAPLHTVLPGRRFFDPLAAALIEQRRDILWSRSNAHRAVQILRAVTNAPDGFIRNQKAYLRLRVAIKRLDGNAVNLPISIRDEIAAELWEVALMVEEGDLQSAKERLARAQDRLDQAIRKGASPAEIDALMDEMRRALKAYTKQLNAEAKKRGDQTSDTQSGPSMSADQLQQMLDKLQSLMEQGKTAEAAQLMEQLRQFMDNMQVAEGGGGEGGDDSPSGRAMKDLGDTLRGQQGLSDDAFRDMQKGQPGPDGQGGSDGRGGDEKSLAQRQQDLRERLDRLGENGALPGEDTEQGQSGRENLDGANRAMRDAEQALRDGDLPSALDKQAEALQALREGISDLGAAMADQAQAGQGTEPGQDLGDAGDPGRRDPLGRQNALRNGSDENLLQGEDVYRRADDLLNEIRRRSGELNRPDGERSYLKRLLDLF